MTCQECQPLAIDLARGLPPFDVGGAVQRADLLSHIATCKQCAQWLREQEALSDALRATAAADASLAAPAGVEANVMAAWRARQVSQQSTGLATNPRSRRAQHGEQQAQQPDRAGRRAEAVWPRPATEPLGVQKPVTLAQLEAIADVLTPERWVRDRGAAWPAGRAAAFAAAATILIAALTMASVRWLNPATEPGPAPLPATGPAPATAPLAAAGAGTSSAAGASRAASASSPVAGEPSNERAAESRNSSATLVLGTGTNAAVIEVLPEKGKKPTKGPPAPAPPRASTSHAANTAAAGFDAGHGIRIASHVTRGAIQRGSGTRARAVNVAREANEFNGPAFVLLPYVEPLRPTEMRHIMRVRMPRAQLAAGELRAGGADDASVLADVLVGEDGTARAVRIVQ